MLVKQHDITDCGAACLGSVAAYYRLNMPVSRIRQYASTDKKGTSVLGLIEGATRLGFSAKGVKGPPKSLFTIPLPAIAHVVIDKRLHHYVVIYKAKDGVISYMDPADGRMHKVSAEKFGKIWTGVIVLLSPAEEFVAGNKKVSVFKRFRFLLKPHRKILLQVLLGAVVYTLIGLSTSIFLQKIVDHVLPDGNRNLLNLMGLVMIILLLLRVFINHIRTLLTIKTGQQIDARLILGYYKHLLKLPQQFFDTMRVGEIISRMNDAVKIRVFINDVLIGFAINIFILVFSFGLMFTYYWKLALVMFCIVPLYLLIYYIADRLNKKTQRELMENAAGLETQLVESINSVSTVKRFGIEDYANIKTENHFIKLLNTVYTSGVNTLWIGNSSGFISVLFTILLLWIGTGFVLDNIITPGELLSFYAIIGYFTGPVSGLIGMNKTARDAMIAADRLFEIMDVEREGTENKTELTPPMIGDIRFKKVSFRYGSRVTVFEDFDLCIPAGKITAVVGESGSGKTTLLSLLQYIYPLQSGSISIGKYDIKYLDSESLRKVVSVVPQRIDLFAGNVVENIAIGEFEPDMKKIIDISTRLGMMNFIEKLPAGFNTYIGENGASLSGGQRQRLAIARALYREPEILVLDEATSSLDSASEQYIQQTISSLREEGKTVILIAHRLSTVVNADKIVVLHEGRLAEEGTHDELLDRGENYSEMWDQQFPGSPRKKHHRVR